MNREQILTTLFNLLSGVSGIKTFSRRIKLWGDVAASNKPCLFMVDHGDTYVRTGKAVPQIVTMDVGVYIYITSGKDASAVPSTTINNILDAVDTALAPSPVTGFQTLGGLVSHAWIEGKIFKDPGDLDGDGIAIIPIKILTNI